MPDKAKKTKRRNQMDGKRGEKFTRWEADTNLNFRGGGGRWRGTHDKRTACTNVRVLNLAIQAPGFQREDPEGGACSRHPPEEVGRHWRRVKQKGVKVLPSAFSPAGT